MSLLRSSKAPDDQADMGMHAFGYALAPFASSWQLANIPRLAAAFNTPVHLGPSSQQLGMRFCVFLGTPFLNAPDAKCYFNVSAPGVVLDCIKLAEASDDVIVRLYESHGGRVMKGRPIPICRHSDLSSASFERPSVF